MIQRLFKCLLLVCFAGMPAHLVSESFCKQGEISNQIVIKDQIQGDLTLSLVYDLTLRNGRNSVFVTLHRLNKDPVSFTRLTFWNDSSRGCIPIATYNAWENIVLSPFVFDGHNFLYIDRLDPSASATWVASAVYYVNDNGDLKTVSLQRNYQCDVELPELSLDESSATRYSFYRLGRPSSIYFNAPMPSGGRIVGELKLLKIDNADYGARVVDCHRIPDDD